MFLQINWIVLFSRPLGKHKYLPLCAFLKETDEDHLHFHYWRLIKEIDRVSQSFKEGKKWKCYNKKLHCHHHHNHIHSHSSSCRRRSRDNIMLQPGGSPSKAGVGAPALGVTSPNSPGGSSSRRSSFSRRLVRQMATVDSDGGPPGMVAIKF